MDETQKKSAELFAKLMNQPLSSTTSVGRYEFDNDKDFSITKDILEKLNIAEKSTILDIGCGLGGLNPLLMKSFSEKNAEVHLMDIPEVIEKIKDASWFKDNQNIFLHPGIFPEHSALLSLQSKKFDRILVYSVLHYTSEPSKFIRHAVDKLAPGGRLLIGDLPNVNKKGRFLATQSGRAFDANYKAVDLSAVPIFRNHEEYVNSSYNTQNSALNDQWLTETIKDYRAQGVHVYVLPQPENLPMFKTREDLLFIKEFE